MDNSKIEKTCLNIIKACFLIILLVPLFFSSKTYFTFTVSKALLFYSTVQVMFLTWIYLVFSTKSYRPKNNIVSISVLSYFLVITLSTIFSINPVNSFWSSFIRMGGTLMWIHLIGFFIVSSSIIKKQDWIKYSTFSVLVALIGSILFWLNLFNIENTPLFYKGSFVGNSSFLASYLIFNIFFALYSYIKHKNAQPNNKYRIVSIMGLFILIPTLLASDGRAGIMAFTIGLIAIMLFSLNKHRNKKIKTISRIALGLFLITILITAILLHCPDSWIQNKFSGFTNGARIIVWQQAWEAFLERPVLGWGLENLAISSNLYHNPSLILTGEISFDRAHNVIYDTLIETGILGLLSYLFIIISSIASLIISRTKKIISYNFATIASTILIIHFLINLSVFDTLVSYVMFIFLLAWIASLIDQHKPKNHSEKRKSLPLLILLIIILLFNITYTTLLPLYKNKLLWSVHNISSLDNSSMAILEKNLYKSSGIDRGHIESYPLTNFLENQNQDFDINKRGMLFWSIEIQKAIESNPLDYYNYLNLGTMYNAYGYLNNDYSFASDAERILEQAIILSPTNPMAYLQLIKVKMALNKPTEALGYSNLLMKLEPGFGVSYLYSINLARQLNNQKILDQLFKQAEANDLDLKYFEHQYDVLSL